MNDEDTLADDLWRLAMELGPDLTEANRSGEAPVDIAVAIGMFMQKHAPVPHGLADQVRALYNDRTDFDARAVMNQLQAALAA